MLLTAKLKRLIKDLKHKLQSTEYTAPLVDHSLLGIHAINSKTTETDQGSQTYTTEYTAPLGHN